MSCNKSLGRAALGFLWSGAAATLTHVATAIGLITVAGLAPSLANGLAFALATGVSYIGNTRWSFRAKVGFATAWRFLLVSVAAGLLTMLLAGAVETAGGHFLAGIALVVLVMPPLVFLVHRGFTYRMGPLD
ncbi:MAG: GtrA family protein [Burkholderiales bacterium]|nr:GtrA family protein [Burkholderiales bacterium]